MNMLDVIIGSILVFGAVRGFMKGLIVEVISLVAVILGIIVAIKFSPVIASLLEDRVDWAPQVTKVVAYAGTFALALLIVFLAGKFFTKIAEAVALGFMNKILGGLFGALKYGMIISVLLILYDNINTKIPIFEKETTEESILFPQVKRLAPWVFPYILNADQLDLKIDGKGKI